MIHGFQHDDGTMNLTASEARGEFYREAGFCRGDDGIDFAEEQQAYNEAEAAEEERQAARANRGLA